MEIYIEIAIALENNWRGGEGNIPRGDGVIPVADKIFLRGCATERLREKAGSAGEGNKESEE